MQTENFGFLEGYDVQLIRLAALAERYFSEDPNTCLIKLRQFAELVAKQVAARSAVETTPKEEFAEVLRRLSYERIVPRSVADLLHKLRKLGNAAAHDGFGDHREALSALKIARELHITSRQRPKY